MDKKKISMGVVALAVALIIGIVSFNGGKSATADELDYNAIKEQLKEELSTEYDAKIQEQQERIAEQDAKINDLNNQLSTKDSELKKAIEEAEKKITYDTANKNLEEDKKNNPEKYPQEVVTPPVDDVKSGE